MNAPPSPCSPTHRRCGRSPLKPQSQLLEQPPVVGGDRRGHCFLYPIWVFRQNGWRVRCDLRGYGFHRSNEVVFANPRRCRFRCPIGQGQLACPLLGIDRHSQQIAGFLPHSRAKGVVERAQINASVRPQKQAVVLAVRVAIPHQRVEDELLCPLPNQRAAVRQPFQQGKRVGSGHGILRMPRNAQRLREVLNVDTKTCPSAQTSRSNLSTT